MSPYVNSVAAEDVCGGLERRSSCVYVVWTVGFHRQGGEGRAGQLTAELVSKRLSPSWLQKEQTGSVASAPSRHRALRNFVASLNKWPSRLAGCFCAIKHLHLCLDPLWTSLLGSAT